jgi:hypothetical protein
MFARFFFIVCIIGAVAHVAMSGANAASEKRANYVSQQQQVIQELNDYE